MKKLVILSIGSLMLLFTACKKKDAGSCTYTESTLVAPASEIAYLDSALTANSIAAIQHPSGVFYTVDSLGSGATPGLCSIMRTTYSGYLYGNATPFDSFTDPIGTNLSLGSLIVGWQKVMPLVKAGGKITLYIPPTLGYGEVTKRNGDGDVIIPAHSFLVFKINLLQVN